VPEQALYFYLGSGVRARANGALGLLRALAQHSVQSARELAQALDFSLSALPRLYAIPRWAPGVDTGQPQQASKRVQALLVA
jgi:hypothetical protein